MMDIHFRKLFEELQFTAAFAAAIKDNKDPPDKNTYFKRTDEKYDDPNVELLWTGWKMSRTNPPAHMLTLNGHQLQQALEFAAPDDGDSKLLDTEVTIQYCEEARGAEAETLPAGHYVWLTEYPGEGRVRLDEKP